MKTIEKIESLKNNINNIKLELSNTITEKGVATSPKDSFATIAENINKIEGSKSNKAWYPFELEGDGSLRYLTGKLRNLKIYPVTETAGNDNGDGTYNIYMTFSNGYSEYGSDYMKYKERMFSFNIPEQLYNDGVNYNFISGNEKNEFMLNNGHIAFDLVGTNDLDENNVTLCDGKCKYYNGKIYYVFGKNNDNVMIYDIEQKVWSEGAPLPIISRYGTPYKVLSPIVELYNDKLYCFGGSTGSSQLPTAHVYDITKNSWEELETTLPVDYFAYSGSTIYNDDIYILGGSHSSTGYSYVYKYNITSNTWTKLTNMPKGVSQLTSQLHNGKIYCFGGKVSSSSVNSNIFVYDIAGDSWETISSTYAWIGSTSQLYNGKIYLLGGYDGGTDGFKSVIDIYDIQSDKWSTGPNLACGRENAESVLIDDKIYCIGGYSNKYNYDMNPVMNFLEVYNITNNKLNEYKYVPACRQYCTYLKDGNDVYIFSGLKNAYVSNGKVNTAIEAYNLQTKQFRKITDLPQEVFNTANIIINNKLYCVGGESNESGKFKYVYKYDLEEDSWERKADLPINLSRGTLYEHNNKIYCFGGYVRQDGTYYDQYSSAVYIYDIASDSWTTESTDCTASDSKSLRVGNLIYFVADNKLSSYNLETNQWNEHAGLYGMYFSSSDTACSAFFLKGDYLYLAYGSNAQIYRYSITNDEWEEVNTDYDTCPSYSFVNIYDEGASSVYSFTSEGKVYVYDIDTDTWYTMNSFNELFCSSFAFIEDNKIYLIGGAFYNDAVMTYNTIKILGTKEVITSSTPIEIPEFNLFRNVCDISFSDLDGSLGIKGEFEVYRYNE